MVHKKSVIFASVFLFALMFSMVGVMAMEADNVTIVTPASSGSLTGATALFNISLVTGYEAENWTSVRIYLTSAGLTANTTEALATDWVANETDLILNGTLDSTVFEDGNDYIFKAQLFNGTDYINQTVTGITIQNTVPTAPSLTTHTNHEVISTAETATFSFTVVDAETTSCTYVIARGGASSGSDYISGTGTYSGSTCSFTKAFSGSVDNGAWYVSTTASDETDTTASSQTIIDVNLPANSGGLPGGLPGSGDDTVPGTDGDNSNLIWWILGILAIIVVVVIIFIIAS